jgi:hypothetical protein
MDHYYSGEGAGAWTCSGSPDRRRRPGGALDKSTFVRSQMAYHNIFLIILCLASTGDRVAIDWANSGRSTARVHNESMRSKRGFEETAERRITMELAALRRHTVFDFMEDLETLQLGHVRAVSAGRTEEATELMRLMNKVWRNISILRGARALNLVRVFRIITHYPRRVLSDDQFRTGNCLPNGHPVRSRMTFRCGILIAGNPPWHAQIALRERVRAPRVSTALA